MVNIKRLSNGIRVVTENLPHFRTVTFGVWVRVGSVNETKEENGLAHMLEHMFFKGTVKKSAKELADSIAFIGDDVNAFTSREYTSFYGTTISEHIAILIDLISEMILDSRFDESDIKKEKRVILDEIDMYEDSPEDLVYETLQSCIYKGHPLSNIISGTKRTVKSFKREELISFKERYYVPERMVISIAGSFDEEAVIMHLESTFGKMKAGSTNTGDILSYPYPVPCYNKCFCSKYKDIEQVYINMAFPSIQSGTEERFAFTIMNSLFGGSNNSRLFQRIREESGLAYSVYSYTNEFAQAGLFHIDVTVNPSKVLQVSDMIFDIIKDIRISGIKEEELAIHKSQIKTELIMGNESAKSKMSSNAKSVFLRNYVISLYENLENIDLVTVDDVNKLIENYLRPQNVSLCLIGAKEAVDRRQMKLWWENIINLL